MSSNLHCPLFYNKLHYAQALSASIRLKIIFLWIFDAVDNIITADVDLYKWINEIWPGIGLHTSLKKQIWSFKPQGSYYYHNINIISNWVKSVVLLSYVQFNALFFFNYTYFFNWPMSIDMFSSCHFFQSNKISTS